VPTRATRSIGVLVVTWAGAVTMLCIGRPRLVDHPAAWSGEAVARVACWALLVAYTAWMTATACAWSVVVVRHGAVSARGVTRWAPPVARRMLRTALAGTLAVAPPVPPVTLHVGPDGHLSGSGERAPTRPSTPPTSAAPAAPRPVMRARPPRREPPAPVARPHEHRVVAGDNLWTIARAELARRDGRLPQDPEIVPYWLRVVAANRATLRSGDPNLIYPSEIVILPNP
jgi:hypothetical protein